MKLLTLRTEIKTKALEVLSPSDGHRFGGAVTGDDGDETRVVCVLLEKQHSGSEGVSFHDPNTRDYLCDGTFFSLTRRMRRMAATPDVAMTLALLGTRFSSVGMTLSAPWSNLLPRMDDKCLSKMKVKTLSYFFFIILYFSPFRQQKLF